LVHKEQPIPSKPPELRVRLKHLVDLGIVERIGKGQGARYMLCQQYYILAGKSSMYTRKIGMDREMSKDLLLKHIRKNAKEGSKLSDLRLVLPSLSKDQIQRLTAELKNDNLIEFRGKTKASLWYLAEK
jgi:hypothetical protein